jgi:hypothetical protein
MDQHLLDAWLTLEGGTPDSEPEMVPANGHAAGKIPPGHAWFVREDDGDEEVMLIACEQRERLEPLLRHVELNLRARSITVMMDNTAVPVVVVMLRISSGEETSLFSAWINELSPRTEGVLENLATQSQLLIALLDEKGRTVGTSLARNVLATRMENMRGWISDLARASPWTPPQFAAAKAYIRSQHPTNEDLWARFDEDSAPVSERELTAVPA